MEKNTAGHITNVVVRSIDGMAGVRVEADIDNEGKINIVPMDDCIIEVVWSYEHERMVGVIREKSYID